MQLKKFRIKNYKSIKDSGDCYLSDDGITILAGKNESGKSAILEALTHFHQIQLPENGYPIDESGKPEVELVFSVEQIRLDGLAEEAQIEFDEGFKNYLLQNDVSIIKKHDRPLQVDNKILEKINHEIMQRVSEHFHNIESIFKEFERIEPNFMTPSFGEKHDYNSVVWSVGFSALWHLLFHKYLSRSYKPVDGETSKRIKHLTKLFESEMKKFELEDPKQLTEKAISDSFIRNTPMIVPIIFSRANKYTISVEEISHDDYMPSFIAAAFGLLKVKEGENKLKTRNRLINVSDKVTKDFATYWEQDNLSLKYELDEGHISFLVSELEKANLYAMEQRSDGLQHFLSSFLQLWSNKYVDSLFLIDEPDLHLHPQAQKNVLKLYETVVNIGLDSQIIFSTHSPYMIESDNLHRVRLVNKSGKEGTTIENKYWKGSNNETLTPILNAIGLDLNQGFSIAKENNVLTEGQSDYFYLTAFKEILQRKGSQDIDLHIIPCVGASKTEFLASILIGWKLNFVVLLDNDKKGNEIRSRLMKSSIIEENQVVLISETKNTSIEDLFSRSDFCKLVLEINESEVDENPNSSLVKAIGNHVLLAKKFLERVLTDDSIAGSLSSETIKAFEKIFNDLHR